MADSRVWKSEIEIFLDAGGWQTAESDGQKLKFFTDRGGWQTLGADREKFKFFYWWWWVAYSRVWQQRIQIFSTDGVGWQTVESDSQKLKFLIDSGRWQTAESESQKSIFLLILAGGRQKSLTVQKLSFSLDGGRRHRL